ncbi:ATP-binding protein [Phytohabitans kaempferiae]|uniref:ATP-binding protein n=1 Tax=Phytohabitans kaempferiae TaxID=1620943 RepID=A0ABV6MHG7_9ACTN
MGRHLRCVAAHEPPLAVVRVTGRLTLRGAARLRVALLKSLAEQPFAVLVDVAGMAVDEDMSLTVFMAAARHAAAWPAAPIILCSASPEARAALCRVGADRHVTLCADLDQGRAVAARRELPEQVRDQLSASPTSVPAARRMVTALCERWELSGVVSPARLVISELVANAVRHAGTSVELTITRSRRHLHLAVRDYHRQRSPVRRPPAESEPDRRGLLLVEAVSANWGCTLLPDGKVTWASLSRAPRPVPRA